MRMSHRQLEELLNLLELLEKDETIVRTDNDGKLQSSISHIKDIVLDILI